MSLTAIGYLIGAGSMSLGIERAGFKLLEIWETPGYGKNAQTWALNRREPHLQPQILNLDEHNYTHFWRRLQEYGDGGVDMIYGNPPCGGVSNMTCSRIDSPTNCCMKQWMRMVAPAGAPMILMENGYQLATPRMAPLLRDLTEVLEYYDYHWWTWEFYSPQLGTPQIRRRMFLCATKEPPVRLDLVSLGDLPPYRQNMLPCSIFLRDLQGVPPSPDPVRSRSGAIVTQHWYNRPDYVLEMNRLIDQHLERATKHYLTPAEAGKLAARAERGDSVAQARLDKESHQLWAECPKQFSGMHMHRPHLVDWNAATQTIIGYYRYVHPIDRRMLTMREMARLMGYPDEWEFHKLEPALIAQGIPVNNSWWAAYRLAVTAGYAEVPSVSAV